MSDKKKPLFPFGRTPGEIDSPLHSPFGVPASVRTGMQVPSTLQEPFNEAPASIVRSDAERVELVDSFYDGLPPDDPQYFSFVAGNTITLPLAVGTVDQLFNFQVPNGMFMDISGIEFKMVGPNGAGGIAFLPDDIALIAVTFEILRDNVAVFDFLTQIVVNLYSTPWVGRNILELMGDTPGHVLLAGGSTLTINAITNTVAAALPANTAVLVTVSGRWIPNVIRNRLLAKERGSE